MHLLRTLLNITRFGLVIRGFGLRRESAPDVSQRLSMPTRQGLGNFTLRTEAKDTKIPFAADSKAPSGRGAEIA